MKPGLQVEAVEGLKKRLAYTENLKEVINRIHSAKDLNGILIDLKDAILDLFDAERITLYAVDYEKKEIFSRFLEIDHVKEIRLPINERSIAGYVAKYQKMVNISNVHDKGELARVNQYLTHDSSWEIKTGFKTKEILASPLLYDNKWLMGVIQLLNKKGGDRFTREDEWSVKEIARTLGIAFYNQYLLSKKKPGKFDYLLSQHLITEEELNSAIHEAREKGVDVESILIEKFKVSRKDIGVSLSQFYKCPFVEFDEKKWVSPELIKGIKLEYLKANLWVPLKQEGDVVEVLVDNPQDIMKMDDIRRCFPEKRIQPVVGLRKDILQFIAMSGGEYAPAGSIASIIGELVTEEAEEKEEEEEGAGAELKETDSSIVRLANRLIIDAYNMGASDIHIEPYGPTRETVVRYRVDGDCFEYQKIPPSHRRAIVSRIKIMSRLDIAERRKPQDGKIKFRLPSGREIELRVATLPTVGVEEDVVMRILAASEPLPLDNLSMTERNSREFKNILSKPYGMILCVGPTGSGKTTTLHAALGFINTPDVKIWTAEDPVEITQYGLRQVQVQPKIGFTFASAMRAFLRADPDVIMVGEMRDEETASIGIEASLTGHLVLSTLHTNSAAETVVRLLDMGIDPFNFADALLGILAQRLARRLCNDCKERYHPPEDEFNEMALSYGKEELERLGVSYTKDLFLYRAQGCDACRGSGYKGRIALHELLIASDEIKRMVQTKARVTEMVQQAKKEGMTTLLQDGILKVIQGVTDFRQVKAVAMK